MQSCFLWTLLFCTTAAAAALFASAANVTDDVNEISGDKFVASAKDAPTTTTTVVGAVNHILTKSLVLLQANKTSNGTTTVTSNVTLQVHGTTSRVSLNETAAAAAAAISGLTSGSLLPSGRRRVAVGKVRLVGGRSEHEGNVEVFYMGRWGSVCDDEWDSREAAVVCRQLGYDAGAPKATANSQFGLSRKRIWMDNLYCYGDEANLTSCPFDGWGNHDCTAQEAAGVVCVTLDSAGAETINVTISDSDVDVNATTTLPAFPPLSSLALLDAASGHTTAQKSRIRHALPGPLSVRIVGGRVREEGRVEVRLGDGPWGLICGDGWGIFEATATCKMLGLGHAQAAVQSSFFGGHHLPMLLSGVRCSGRENSLADCDHDQMGSVFCPGRTENIAGVICTEILPDLTPDHYELERSAYLEDRQLFFLQCAMEENCLARSAYGYDQTQYGWQLEVRRLLRFTAKIANIGNADFRPFIPKHMWQWHMCHMHYHSMEVFANFDIIDSGGRKVAEGHKASFCLEDNACSPGVQPKYVCANYGDQGISVGCTDIYLHTVDCQWIDITDVKPGVYFLKVSINPDFKVPEMTFDNNAALCNVYYNSYQIHVWNCTITRP